MSRIIITVDNEVGVLADITTALADRNINIQAINTEAMGATGVISLTTDSPDESLIALADAGFRATVDDTLVVKLKDEPGALAKVAEKFKDAGVNIDSVHFLNHYGGYTHVAIGVRDEDRAEAEALIGREFIL